MDMWRAASEVRIEVSFTPAISLEAIPMSDMRGERSYR
jgi:hypothetical protein